MVNILGQVTHIPSPLSVFSFLALLVWVELGLGSTSLHPLYLLLLCWHWLSQTWGIRCVCVHVLYVRVSVSASPAPLHAEKADISRGSVIERILLPASHCHGGWREHWIVGRERNRGEGKGWEYPPFICRYEWNPICLISPLTPLVTDAPSLN